VVELIVTSEFCNDTIQELIIVHQLPIPKMEFKNHCLGEAYTFVNNSYNNDSSQGPIDDGSTHLKASNVLGVDLL
jgi:hypothetical protein